VREEALTWTEACRAVCREHPDVVAVFESSHGRLALLLRATLVPLPHERTRWSAETRRTARAVTVALRPVGVQEPPIVLQWRPASQVAHILRRWTCQYDADPARRAELTELVTAELTDRHAALLAWGVSRATGPARTLETPIVPFNPENASSRPLDHALIAWYRNMAPTWLDAEPLIRRQLILRTHRWIVESVLAASSPTTPLEDLRPDGPLARALAATIPADELPRWRSWIRLVLADLRRALAWPANQRSSAWGRWLFLIPYSVPVRRPEMSGGVAVRSGGSLRGV
jgi:hypothetical protein